MDQKCLYPYKCRKSIRVLTERTGSSEETAYAMMLITAALMDMHPEDTGVVTMILKDCGVGEEKEDDTA